MTALLVAWVAVSVGYLAGLFQAHRAELKAAAERLEAIEAYEAQHQEELDRAFIRGIVSATLMKERKQAVKLVAQRWSAN